MEEKELIAKIKMLSQIKPNQNWVNLTKEAIFNENNEKAVFLANNLIQRKSKLSWFKLFFLKPAYAGVFALLILIGIFAIAQNSMLGDYLYSLKRISEKTSFFLTGQNKAKANFELVEKKLEELNHVVESNQTKKLALAIKEVQKSVDEVSKSYSDKDIENIKKIVKIDKDIKKFQSRGIVIDSQSSQKLVINSLIYVLQDLIADLEKGSLNEKQKETLTKMKDLIEKGNYTEALELYYSELYPN